MISLLFFLFSFLLLPLPRVSGVNVQVCVSLGIPQALCNLLFTAGVPQIGGPVECPILFTEDIPGLAIRINTPPDTQNQTKDGSAGEVAEKDTAFQINGNNSSLVRAENETSVDEKLNTEEPLDLRPSVAVQGGNQAADRLRRYMVSVESDGSLCSGVVIGRRWVMTSAHCEVQAGANVRFGPVRVGAPVLSATVRRTFNHPSFPGGVTANYDAAILELNSNAPAGTLFMRVNRNAFIPAPGAPVRTVGYGDFSLTGFDGILRQVDLRVRAPALCQIDLQQSSLQPNQDVRLVICAISTGGLCGTW